MGVTNKQLIDAGWKMVSASGIGSEANYGFYKEPYELRLDNTRQAKLFDIQQEDGKLSMLVVGLYNAIPTIDFLNQILNEYESNQVRS